MHALMGTPSVLPEFDNAPPEKRPEKGLGIRQTLSVYANLRPVRTYRPARLISSEECPRAGDRHDYRA